VTTPTYTVLGLKGPHGRAMQRRIGGQAFTDRNQADHIAYCAVAAGLHDRAHVVAYPSSEIVYRIGPEDIAAGALPPAHPLTVQVGTLPPAMFGRALVEAKVYAWQATASFADDRSSAGRALHQRWTLVADEFDRLIGALKGSI
jgi:hypothetical protein